jgi:hypothetical protein
MFVRFETNAIYAFQTSKAAKFELHCEPLTVRSWPWISLPQGLIVRQVDYIAAMMVHALTLT